MDRNTAIAFLKQHQPLPADDQLTEELIQQYQEVLNYCHVSDEEELIPFLLHAFGEGDGWGTYQLVDEVLWHFPLEIVVPHLLDALQSPCLSVRYWCAEVAAVFPHPALIEPLRTLLASADEEIRFPVIRAFAFIEDARVDTILEDALLHEHDEQLRELLNDVLTGRKNGARLLPERPSAGSLASETH